MMSEAIFQNDIFSPDLKNSINTWSAIAKKSQATIHVKGGAIRDSVVNQMYGTTHKVKDVDITVPLSLFHILRIAISEYGATIQERGKRKKLPRYSLKFSNSDLLSDISLAQAKPVSFDEERTLDEIITENAQLSNFDINTLTCDVTSRQIYDPLNAMDSFRKRTMNLVSVGTIYRDPSTILDGLKIKAKLGFEFSDTTIDIIRGNALVIIKLQTWFLEQKLENILKYSTRHQLQSQLVSLGILEVRPKIIAILDKIQNKQ